LPAEIIENAKKIEKTLDKWCEEKKVVVQSLFADQNNDFEKEKYEKIKQKLEDLDIYNITPIKALEILEEVKREL
jgi:DNA mismatch repair ATPase MutS